MILKLRPTVSVYNLTQFLWVRNLGMASPHLETHYELVLKTSAKAVVTPRLDWS